MARPYKASNPEHYKMHVFIPALCYNHTANTEWMMSLFRLFLFFKENGINATIMPITFDSLVSRARNAAVANFLSNPEATHILFIDSDIEFSPEQVLRLFHVNEPVVAAGYPQKWLSEEKVKQIMTQPTQLKAPFELATTIPVHLLNGQSPSEVMEAEYATTGFLLIQRKAFETLMEKYPERHYRNDIDGYMSADPRFFYDFFPILIHPVTKRLESEDYGFSRLWREAGGKIHIATDVTLTHHGWYGFKGNLYRQLTTKL